MAHYAEINEFNIVTRVVVIDNEHEPTEQDGINYCINLLGGTNWKKTSYNGNIRKNFAGPGFIYDPIRDVFIPPKPYPSWVFNEDTCRWNAPVPYPTDVEKNYMWDEITVSWKPRLV